MNPSQSESPTSWHRRLFPVQLPPVVVLIAWLLIFWGGAEVLGGLLGFYIGLSKYADFWHKYGQVLLSWQVLSFIPTLVYNLALCCCGIALLRTAWWARRATVAVLAVALLFGVVLYLGLTMLMLVNPGHFHLPLHWDDVLQRVLGWGSPLVMIYFLTLPHIVAVWPRRHPDAPPATKARSAALRNALLGCAGAVEHRFPPALPAEVAYIALAMLLSAGSRLLTGVKALITLTSHAHPVPLDFPWSLPVDLCGGMLLLVLAIALLRLAPWALNGTIITLCGLFLLSQVQEYHRYFSPSWFHQLPLPSRPDPQYFCGLLLQLCFLLVSGLVPALKVYFLRRPRVRQVFGQAPATTGAPVNNVPDDVPGV